MRIGAFDFQPVLEGLYVAMPSGTVFDLADKKSLVSLFAIMFPKDPLAGYTVKFLETDFRGDASHVRHLHAPPSKVKGKELLGRYNEGFRNAVRGPDESDDLVAAVDGQRLRTEYLLTRAETHEAMSVYEHSDLLQDTIATLQATVMSYCADLEETHAQMKGSVPADQHANVASFIGMVRKVAGNFAMIHDLMPVMAFSMAREGWKPGDALTEREFRRGAATAFSQSVQAFKSIEVDPSTDMKPKTTYCPFTPLLMKWMGTIPATQPDGHIAIVDGESRQGALPAFVVERLQALSRPAARPDMPEHLFSL